MDLDVIRGVPNVQTPEWRQFFKNSREDLRKSQVAVREREQKRFDDLAVNIAKKLSKQEVTTTEVEKPTSTEQDNKVDAKAILNVIKEIATTLESHAELIENLDERVDKLEQRQPSQGAVKRDAITGRSEPSQRDLEIIEMRAEQIGLNGELKRILPFEVIGGQFAE